MTVQIFVGDCLDILDTLEDESVHCCITSPPYYGLRNYGVDEQIGLENTPEEYIAKIVEVFRKVRRVLRTDGTLWLNLGDSYWGSGKGFGHNWENSPKQRTNTGSLFSQTMKPTTLGNSETFKPKDLMGIPWRVALALQADGWWLRSDIIWHKPNAMPESVTDRPTKAHEYIFLLSKSAKYFYDANAIRETASFPDRTYNTNPEDHKTWELRNNGNRSTAGLHDGRDKYGDGKTRNRRTVWTIPTTPYSGAHFATFPTNLVEPMIKAGTSEFGCCFQCGAPWERVTEKNTSFHGGSGAAGRSAEEVNNSGKWAGKQHGKNIKLGPVNSVKTISWQPTCEHNLDPVPCVILDPFAGAGTVGLVADRLGRDSILIDINQEYAEMASDRIKNDSGWFEEVEVVNDPQQLNLF